MKTDTLLSSLGGAVTLINLSDEYAFIHTYQSRVILQSGNAITLDDLSEAFKATDQLFEQFPLDNRTVNTLIKTIFVEDGALLKAPSVAQINGRIYGVGGRHRLAAIRRYLKFCGEDSGVQLINVELLTVDSTDTLLRLVEADNQSRVMRKPELQHLELQRLGGASFGTEDIAQTILSNDLTPQQAKRLSGQFFTRRNHPKLKTVTRNSIGEMIGCYVLYKVPPAELRKLSRRAEPRVTPEQFTEMMDKAWTLLCELVDSQTVLGRNAKSLADEVIAQLDSGRHKARRQRSKNDTTIEQPVEF